MSGLRSRVCMAAATAVLVAGCADASGLESGSIAQDYDLGEQQLSERGGGDTTRFVVASKNFAEQEILGHITLLALRAAGAEVVDRTGLGGTEAVRSALTAGQIDMYWEYTGTGALLHLAMTDPPRDPGQLHQTIAGADLERNGVEWLSPAPANNTYAIAARAEVYDTGSETYDEDLAGVGSISDLGRLVENSPGKATVCVGPEFSERADGLPGLETHYGFEVPGANVFVLPDRTVYEAVDQGEKCNFGSVFRTSGYIPTLDLQLLEDDEDFFLPYNPSLTVRTDTLHRYPDLRELFTDIAQQLDTETLRELSARVLVDAEAPEDVAEDWLAEQGLI